MFEWAVSYETPTGLASLHAAAVERRAQGLTPATGRRVDHFNRRKLSQKPYIREYISIMLSTFLLLILRLFNDVIPNSWLIKDGNAHGENYWRE